MLAAWPEAEAAFRRAIALAPAFADAYDNLGHVLTALGRPLEAADAFCQAFVLRPAQGQVKADRAIAYYKLGRIEEAAEVYRSWLEEEPDNAVAAHMYAACSGVDVPNRASAAYVETKFDEFAATFDKNLEQLGYSGPVMIAKALASVAAPARQFAILDAGCGTGLCGPHLVKYVRRLVGVDLSAQMLERARLRGCYDELVKADLVDFLRGHPESFDVIVAADTLIYFGALNEFCALAHGALCAEGLLVVTIELVVDGAQDRSGFHLNVHGRYPSAKFGQGARNVGSDEGLPHAPLSADNRNHIRGCVHAAWQLRTRCHESPFRHASHVHSNPVDGTQEAPPSPSPIHRRGIHARR
jgi:predicted TPR repeat methyltransferase